MLFSQMTSPVLEASTSSGMNPAQLCGHSCFRICDNAKAEERERGKRERKKREERERKESSGDQTERPEKKDKSGKSGKSGKPTS